MPATAAAPGKSSKPRMPEVAVAPLTTIAVQDLVASAQVFDHWLRGVSGGYLTLERYSAVTRSRPVIGNVFALLAAVDGLIANVERLAKQQTVELGDWAGLAIDLLGALPQPPGTSMARMALRPTLHLLRHRVASADRRRSSPTTKAAPRGPPATRPEGRRRSTSAMWHRTSALPTRSDSEGNSSTRKPG